MTWDGEDYQARFDRLAASGQDVHGEADFVMSFSPGTVLDAGCGTGRVAIELARRGVEVVGVDVDPSMLATARGLAPDLTWVDADLTEFDLGRTFDVVVLAGNVPLFTPAGTQAALAAACAKHVGGVMVAGFSTDRGYTAEDWDEACTAAGLAPVDRFSTWSRDVDPTAPYTVSVHRQARE
jgi:SAM-dependent methyltransferase